MSHNRRKSVRHQGKGDRRRRSEVRTRRRFASVERLEDRLLLAADINPFHNYVHPADVDNSGEVTALDALITINSLNNGGSRPLMDLFASSANAAGSGEGEVSQTGMVDVNGDLYLSPSDVLHVINELNAESEPDMAEVRLSIVEDEPVQLGTPSDRQVLTSVAPGDTFRVELYVTDVRTDDDQDPNNGVGNQFGTYAAYTDLIFDPIAFSVPTGNSVGAVNTLSYPINWYNVGFLKNFVNADGSTGTSLDTEDARYPNGPTATLDAAAGKFVEIGSFMDGTTPPGQYRLFQLDVQFQAEALNLKDDSGSINDEQPIVIDVLANDDVVNGSFTFTPQHPSVDGDASPGSEYLLFGDTGGAQGTQGSVVPASEISYVPASVTVNNPATKQDLTVTGFTPGTGFQGSLSLNGNNIQYTPVANATYVDVFTYDVSDGHGNTGTATVTVNVTAPNDPPVNTLPAAASLDEGTTYNFGTDVQVSDQENDSLTVTVSVQDGMLTLGNAGAATNSGNNSISITLTDTPSNINTALDGLTYTPPASNPADQWYGDIVFTMTSNDGNNPDQTNSFTITVNPVNDAPTQNVPGAQVVRVNELPLSFNTTNGNAITVNDVNDKIFGDIDVQVTLEVDQGTLSITPSGVTGDTDGSDGTLVITGKTGDINATLNTLQFNSSQIGQTHTLSILTSDLGNIGGGDVLDSGTDTVQITVKPETSPFAVPDTYTGIAEGSAAQALNVLVNDFNVDDAQGGTNLVIVSEPSLLSGTGTIARTNGDTEILFTPDADYNGDVVFTYTIEDTTDTNVPKVQSTATVTVTVDAVNDSPSITSAPATTSTDEESPLAFTGGLQIQVADVDADDAATNPGLDVTLTVSNGSLDIPTPGNASVSGSGASLSISGLVADVNTALASLVYSPDLDFNGEDMLTITVDDHGNTGSGNATQTATDSVTITVNPVNDEPVNTVPGPQSTIEDQDLAISGISISDVDAVETGADTVQVNLSLNPATGTLTVPGTSGATMDDGDGTDGTLQFTGTQAQVNQELGSLVYSPPANVSDYTTTLTIVTDDLGHVGSGGAKSDTDTIDITVNPINDPMTANDDSGSTDEDTPVTILVSTLLANDVPGPAGSNEATDPQGIVITEASTSTGSVQLTEGNSKVVFTPPADASGQFTFTYTAEDVPSSTYGTPATSDTATVTIDVTPINDPPVLAGTDQVSAAEGQSITFTGGNLIQFTDKDVSSSQMSLTLSLSTDPGALDGTLVLNAGGGTISKTGSSSITKMGTLTELNNMLNGMVFTPATNAEGLTTLSITIDDNGATGQDNNGTTDQMDVTIVISGVNDPPVNQVPGAQTVDEDTDLVFSDGNSNRITIEDIDAGGADIQVDLASDIGTLMVTGPTAALTTFDSQMVGQGTQIMMVGSVSEINAALDGLTYRAPQDWNSTDNGGAKPVLTINTSDLGNTGVHPTLGDSTPLTDSDSLTITVNATNDDPTAVDDYSASEPLLILKDSTGNQIFPLGNDQILPDVGETLTITAARIASGHGTANVAGDGLSVFYSPGAGTEGPTEIEYDISDGNGGTDTGSIFVDTVNFVPADFSGYVYVDANGNGQKDDGEVGLAGVPIRMVGKSIQWTSGPSDVDITVLTEADGSYVFEGVMPNADGESYLITETQPAAYLDGDDSAPANAPVTSAGNDQWAFTLDRFGLADGQTSADNNFGELGLTTENFIFAGNRDLFHSESGSYDPADENSGGLFFGFSSAGELQWYLNIGGWDGIVPGSQLDLDSALEVTVNGNTVRMQNTSNGTFHDVSVDPASYRMIKKVNADGSTVIQIIGTSSATGITWNQVTQAAEGEADAAIDQMMSADGNAQYMDAVDAIFADAGQLA